VEKEEKETRTSGVTQKGRNGATRANAEGASNPRPRWSNKLFAYLKGVKSICIRSIQKEEREREYDRKFIYIGDEKKEKGKEEHYFFQRNISS